MGRGGEGLIPLPEGPSAFCLSSMCLINYDKYRIALLVSAHAPRTPRRPSPSFSLLLTPFSGLCRAQPWEGESNPTRKTLSHPR